MLKNLCAGAVLSVLLIGGAHAQTYPTQPVRIVHGFAAGGNADTISRMIAEPLSNMLGQPFVVEPRPGAGGNVGSDFVANADPDGHTLVLLTGGHTVSGALYRSLEFDAVEDFTFVNRVSHFPFFVAVKQGTFENIEALIAAAHDGGRIRYGSAGVGSTQHLTGELLGRETGSNFLHIPYRGDAGAVTALLGGEVDMIVSAGTSVIGQAEAGELELLAVSWQQPWPETPDVPTLSDTVAPGFDVFSWTGLAAPAGLPDEITEQLASALDEILADSGIEQRLLTLGALPGAMPSSEFHTMVVNQIDAWNEVIDAAGIERQ